MARTRAPSLGHLMTRLAQTRCEIDPRTIVKVSGLKSRSCRSMIERGLSSTCRLLQRSRDKERCRPADEQNVNERCDVDGLQWIDTASNRRERQDHVVHH